MPINYSEYKQLLDSSRATDEALSSAVWVNYGEVIRLVAKDLVSKRNACSDEQTVKAFDLILKQYYLSESEFYFATKDIRSERKQLSMGRKTHYYAEEE